MYNQANRLPVITPAPTVNPTLQGMELGEGTYRLHFNAGLLYPLIPDISYPIVKTVFNWKVTFQKAEANSIESTYDLYINLEYTGLRDNQTTELTTLSIIVILGLTATILGLGIATLDKIDKVIATPVGNLVLSTTSIVLLVGVAFLIYYVFKSKFV